MKDITKSITATINSLTEALIWWHDNQEILTPLVCALEVNGYTVEVSGSGLDISGSGDRDMFLKGLRMLYAHGYRPSRKPNKGETYFGTFFYPNGDVSRRGIWFSFSSTTCRRVQIGVEMKEVPVYEVRCADGDLGVAEEEYNVKTTTVTEEVAQ